MIFEPITKEAYQLFHDGQRVLSAIEKHGIRIDRQKAENNKTHITRQIDRIAKGMEKYPVIQAMRKQFGDKFNLDSDDQIRWALFDHLKIKPTKMTPGKKPSVDKSVLQDLDVDFIEDMQTISRLSTVKNTYLTSILREMDDDGFIHPMFGLTNVSTFRGCVAKGTKVLVVRDFESHKDGVPIETVKIGDLVYCFDDNLNPAIRKVIWAGKTGHREVVRLHWKAARGRMGFLDVTPEHQIRHVHGQYIPAKDLLNDFRAATDSQQSPKCRVLSCNRTKDTLNFTWHNNYKGSGLYEHRVIYSQLVGELKDEDVIHHINGNHYDHRPENLQLESKSSHSKLHASRLTPEQKKHLGDLLRENRHKVRVRYGLDNPCTFKFSKFTCIKLLAKAGGRIRNVPHDHDCFKKCCSRHGIDFRLLKIRYTGRGGYISRGYLKSVAVYGRAEVGRMLNKGHRDTMALYKIYGIDTTRKWANQTGEFVPHNHIITKIEYTGKIVDVYDVEVEEFHNFFANEICVHNSCSNPNFQNMPIRDKEQSAPIRGCIIPRSGYRFGEADFSGVEVRISACYTHDPVMMEYLLDQSKDMHRDSAMNCFMLSQEQMTKQIRYCGKNMWVFPQFYGDWYASCAKALWKAVKRMKLVTADGTPLYDHLADNGIKTFAQFEKHLQGFEDMFWNEWFTVYTQWKKDWYARYLRDGFFMTKTGFRIAGELEKNQVLNFPIQGDAFHCLLQVLIWTHNNLVSGEWRTKLLGQIHDSMVAEIHPEELEMFYWMVNDRVCIDLPAYWQWINVPMKFEMEVAPVNESWFNKKEYKPE